MKTEAVSRNYAFIEEELSSRAEARNLRSLKSIRPLSAGKVEAEGRTLVNFCSNDYLGLSRHPLLKQRAIEFMERYGSGSTASRLICGTLDCFARVENRLAELKETEAALILNSGFQANISIIPALADRHSLILSDQLNHRSLIEGALLSRCRVLQFQHNDLDHLRDLLKQNRDKGHSRILIVTESVFSMDGDRSDIDALVALASEFDAFLIIDEAHATGVMGKRGMGLTCGKKVDLTIGTFGKACGSFGSYVACSARVRDYLVNCCSGFIYTTALPPAIIGTIDAALDIIPTLEKERHELLCKADFLRASLHELGWDTSNSSTQIIPMIIGGEQDTLDLSEWLESRGILATAIRPPTVEKGQARIRLTLCTFHDQEQIDHLVETIRAWGKSSP